MLPLKRRALNRYLTRLNQIISDTSKPDYVALLEARQVLSNVFPPPRKMKAVSAPLYVGQPRRRSTRAASRAGTYNFLRTLTVGKSTASISGELFFKIVNFLKENKKLHAIRELRAATGLGLKESKDLIEGDPSLQAAMFI